MKTYNTNPGYEMDPQLLTHFNQHLDSLFGIYSKLLPFRMDFAYRKNTLSYRCACRYAMCAEILRLINEVGEKLVGYAWVMEYTERKGLHIHFVGYGDLLQSGMYEVCLQLPARLVSGLRRCEYLIQNIRSAQGVHRYCQPAFYPVFRTYPVRDTKARHRISALLLT